MDAAVAVGGAGGTGAAWTRHKHDDLSHLSSEERECLSFLDSAISSGGGSDSLDESATPSHDPRDESAADAAQLNGAGFAAGEAGGHPRTQQQPQPLPRRVMTNRGLALPEALEAAKGGPPSTGPPSPGAQHSGPPSPGSQSSGPPSPGSISLSSSSSGSQCSGLLSLSVPSSGPPSPVPDSPLSPPHTPRPGNKPPLRIAPAHGKEFNTIIKAGVNVTKRRSIMLALLNGDNQANEPGSAPGNAGDPNPVPRSRSQRASLQPGALTGEPAFLPRGPASLGHLGPGLQPPSEPGSRLGTAAPGLTNGAANQPQRRGSEPTPKDPRWKRNFFKI